MSLNVLDKGEIVKGGANASIALSIDTSVPNEGVYGYDKSPEMLKKGLEAQARAHEEFIKVLEKHNSQQ